VHQTLTAKLPATATSFRRYEVLDSLRGVCACTVVLFHFQTTDLITSAAFVRNGWLLVDFFFVLSGFVIFASYGQRLRNGYSLKRFMGLRLGRIYPLHFAILAAFFAVELLLLIIPSLAGRAAFTGIKEVPDAIWQVFLLQFLGSNEGITWNFPAWSIAAEMWTYLFVALLLRFSGRWLWLFTGSLAAICAYVIWRTGTLDHSGLLSLLRCFFGFSLGMAALVLVRRIEARDVQIAKPVGTLIELVMISLVIALVCISGKGPLTLLAPPLFMFAVLVFSQERGWLSDLLNTRFMLWLGLLSYSIYMVHVFVQSRMLDVMAIAQKKVGLNIVMMNANGERVISAQPWAAEGITLAMLALVIAASWLTYNFIERPARDWSRGLFAASKHAV